MPAYMIVAAKIADRQAFIEGYGKRAAELVEQYGGRYVLRGPGAVLLEGEWGDGASMVISEWPDMAGIAPVLGQRRLRRGEETAPRGSPRCRYWRSRRRRLLASAPPSAPAWR